MFLIGISIERKTDGEYSGFFLLKKQDEVSVLDLSVDANIKEITDLALQVNEYLKSMDGSYLTSTMVSLAIEEMIVTIVNTNDDGEQLMF